MVYRDYRCTVPPKVGTSYDGETETIDRTHVWDWNYVPCMMSAIPGVHSDIGGALVGRCIYCGATWEELGDGD